MGDETTGDLIIRIKRYSRGEGERDLLTVDLVRETGSIIYRRTVVGETCISLYPCVVVNDCNIEFGQKVIQGQLVNGLTVTDRRRG